MENKSKEMGTQMPKQISDFMTHEENEVMLLDCDMKINEIMEKQKDYEMK